MKFFPELMIDGYKLGHKDQYPAGTTKIFSNFTPRKSRRGMNEIVFFGLQYFLKELQFNWNNDFFYLDWGLLEGNYKRTIENYLLINNVDTSHLKKLHDLGYLPIEILSLSEGSLCPIGVPPLVMYNTHPDFAWLVNYLETCLSAYLWPMCTSATTAYEYRKILDKFAFETVGNNSYVDYQAHDFSMRGMFGVEAAAMSGAAHLTSFKGSDCLPAIKLIEGNYGYSKHQLASSVPATEHSVMCAGGKENEINTIKRLITEIYPTGLVSIVMDTWNFWRSLYLCYYSLGDLILSRNGKFVFRPDSGDPELIICGNPFSTNTDERAGAIELLYEYYGGSINEFGYKELNPKIGLIYGDSITIERAQKILQRLKDKGFASNCVTFGIGSYTYQYVTRDTDGYAMKSTYAEINDEATELFKDPITDDGTKKSAKGLLAVFKENGKYVLKQQANWNDVYNCEYKSKFKDGRLNNHIDFDQIRENILNSNKEIK